MDLMLGEASVLHEGQRLHSPVVPRERMEKVKRRKEKKENEKIKMTKMKMAFCALPSWRLAVSRGLYMPGKAVSTPGRKANSSCIIYRRTNVYSRLTYETSNIKLDR
jgi:hypothetical protein